MDNCLIKSFYCYSITVVPISPPLPSPTHPTPSPIVNPHTVVHIHGSLIHVLCLVPSSSFHHYTSFSSPLVSSSLLHISMPIILFCLLVYFVHYIPLTGEFIWYLSFTPWLISLSIMLSRSIHAVGKGWCSFFLSAA